MAIVLKHRALSDELKILRILNVRMTLSKTDKGNYLNLEKGYEGEVRFDQMTGRLQSEILVLNDLLLEVKGTQFQIDSLIISKDIIFPYEIKNYEGDYFYESDRLYTLSGKEIKDPLLQLTRCESLLRQLLQNLGYYLSTEGSVVFVNPEFSLYQAPLHKPFILPTQLTHLMEKLDALPGKPTERHIRLAKKLVSLHITKPTFTRLPSYEFHTLKKGPTCGICNSFSMVNHGKKAICQTCGHVEWIDTAIVRSIEELRLLFPDLKITSNVVYEWTHSFASMKTIGRILKQNYYAVGVGQWTYYVGKITPASLHSK
ncbi:nuclease-related domain-containing protein [Neobacillus sp. Marseille-QA0830]